VHCHLNVAGQRDDFRGPVEVIDGGRGNDRVELSGIDAKTALDGEQGFHLGIRTHWDDGDRAAINLSCDNTRNIPELKLHIGNNGSVDAVIWLSGNDTNLAASCFWFKVPGHHNGGRRRPVLVIGLGA